MAIRTWLGKEAASNPPPARRTPSDRVVPSRVGMACTFPTGYVVAVVDDVEEARACVRELVDVGVPPADVQLATADKAIEIHRRQRGGARLLDRIIGALPTDERSIQDEYLMQADKGSQFVVFRSHGKDQEARARRVLAGPAFAGCATTGAGPGRPCSAAPAASPQVSDGPWAEDAHETQEHDRGGGQADAPPGERVASLPARRKWRVVIQNRAKLVRWTPGPESDRYGGLRTAVTHMPGPRPVQ